MKKILLFLLIPVLVWAAQFGYTTIGSSVVYTNDLRQRTSPITMSEDATLDSLVFYFDDMSPSSTYGFGLYTDNANAPNHLVDSSTTVVNITANGWYQLPAAIGVSLTNGSTYWIATFQSGGIGDNDGVRYNAGAGGYISGDTWPPNEPANSYTDGAGATRFSAYIVATPAGGQPTHYRVYGVKP